MSTTYVKPAELASTLQVSRKTVDRWAKQGLLPRPLRIAGTVRYARDDIDRWAKQQQQPGKDSDDG